MTSGAYVRVAAGFLLFVFSFGCVTGGGGTPWATPDQEALDEVQDAELLKAVVVSMQEWRKRHNSHRVKRAESSVCYPEVGCFQDSGPFSYLDMLPSPPEEVGTKFILYSGRARGSLEVPFNNLSSVWPWARSTFNLTAPTKVIVHGFGGSCGHVWVYEMKSALMTVEESNIICVDWENGALIPNYVRAAANTRLVGKQLSMLLDGLNKQLGLPIHNVHVIGFSLGAHVAGFAGAELKNLSRITGLDPAAPLFESQDPRARLDSTDAMFVDVIHSNGENLILGGLGSWQPMGHVDFYPNGGRMQKGCTNLFVGAVSDILWSASDVEGRSLCNHRRAYKFFTDSVSPRCHFPSFPCESYDKFLAGECFPCNGDRRCGNMGYYADRSNGRGTLYLITREEEPFCAHQYHVKVENSPSPVPVTSYGKIELTLISNSEINETLALTQKDDEELKMGTSLARIAVPHPVIQEPKSVEIMYTAYSGWISSGLSNWSVDKVTLTDSFGKSMSVCKKDLVLESGVPVTLPLYPGECNPPRDTSTTPATLSTTSSEEAKDIQPSKDSLTLTNFSSALNLTKFTPTPVFHIGDELLGNSSETDRAGLLDGETGSLEHVSWQPLDFSNTNTLDGSQSKRENARAFNTFLTSVITHNATSNETLPIPINSSETTTTTSERPEIKEPVLMPTSAARSSWPRELSLSKSAIDIATSINQTSQANEKPEITEPVLNPKTTPTSTSVATSPRPSMVKAREISRDSLVSYHSDHDAKWMPAVELNPPPLGGAQTWQHWMTETAPSSASTTTEFHKPDASNSTNNEARKLSLPSPGKILKPITIQFFPQRLAALLAQAEHYARLTLSFPITAMSKLYNKKPSAEPTGSDQDTSASSNTLFSLNSSNQRRAKHFTTVRPAVNEKAVNQSRKTETSRSFSTKKEPVIQPRKDVIGDFPEIKQITQKDKIYVPYSYSYAPQDSKEEAKNSEMPRFIPLLRYSQSDDKKANYEIAHNYSRISKNSAIRPPTYINVEKLNKDKEDDNDYNSYSSDIFRHIYPRIPER